MIDIILGCLMVCIGVGFTAVFLTIEFELIVNHESDTLQELIRFIKDMISRIIYMLSWKHRKEIKIHRIRNRFSRFTKKVRRIYD